MAITGNSARDQAGTSTALSGDGNTLVVGAPGALGNDDRLGYVKVYYKRIDDTGLKWELADTFVGNAFRNPIYHNLQKLQLQSSEISFDIVSAWDTGTLYTVLSKVSGKT